MFTPEGIATMEHLSVRRGTALAAAVAVAASLGACREADPSSAPVTRSATPSARATPAALSPNGTDLTRYTSQQLQWDKGSCTSDVRSLRQVTARTACAKVTAPKDYSDPSKGDITLLVTRTTASAPTGQARQVFTNPGGPGAPGGSFSVLTAALSPLGKTADVLAVDPRGTGGSTPVSCTPASSGVTDYRGASPVVVGMVQSADQRTVSRCVASHSDYLPYITTDNTARDTDLVRRLLKAPTIDYYGVSAGTWLAARYATLFPQQVGRFVLDSNTDFTASFQTSFDMQPMSFQRRFDQMFRPWAARHDTSYRLGTDATQVGATYERIRAAAGRGELRPFTPNILDSVTAQNLYSDKGFGRIATVLTYLGRASRGDSSALRSAVTALSSSSGNSDPTDFSEDTVFRAITCNDTAWQKNPADYADTARTQGAKYPLVGYKRMSDDCAYWPYAAPRTIVDTSKAAPMLMVQTQDDPATAYEGAVDAHRKSPNTRLLSVDDQGNHGAVLAGGNPCVEKAAYGYLMNGTLIAKDSVCPGVALPGDSKVYPVGDTPQGVQLSMPNDETPGLVKVLKKLFAALLDQLIHHR